MHLRVQHHSKGEMRDLVSIAALFTKGEIHTSPTKDEVAWRGGWLIGDLLAEGQLHTGGRRLLVNEVTFQATVGVWMIGPSHAASPLAGLV